MLKLLKRKSGTQMAEESAAMTVGDYFSKNVSVVGTDATIEKAIKRMVKDKANSVVVVNNKRERKVKGMFSLQDVISLIVPDSYENVESLAAFSSPDMLGEELSKIKGKRVSTCMTSNVLTLKPADSVSKAVSILALRKIRQAPVVDDSKKLIGYISRGHVKRAIVDLLK